MSSFGEAGDGLRVRPYAITGGRTRARTELEVETIVFRTPLGEERFINAREAIQAIALFRLVLPSAWLRLAGGREYVLGELQAMGLLAGANALIVGNYLTTGGRPAEEDHALLEALGMPVADGPGEGRFVVDGDGAHARPAQPTPPTASGRPTIPVSAG